MRDAGGERGRVFLRALGVLRVDELRVGARLLIGNRGVDLRVVSNARGVGGGGLVGVCDVGVCAFGGLRRDEIGV